MICVDKNRFSRVEQRKRETKNRILSTCERLFVYEKTYTTVTMREIAKQADVSTGALYLHFKNKEEILATLFYDFLQDHFTTLERRIMAKSTPKERIFVIFDFLAELIQEPRLVLYIQIPLEIQTNDFDGEGTIWDKLTLAYENAIDNISKTFEQAIEYGDIRGYDDPRLLSITLLTTFMSLFRTFHKEMKYRYHSGPALTYTIEEIFGMFRTTFLKGIFSPNPTL